MIDMHSHILPEIDDGSRGMDETIEMIKEAKNAGFTSIVSTSHFYLNHYETEEKNRQNLINDVKNNIEPIGINMNIYVGSEIFVTSKMTELLFEHKASSINGTRYVLFELPFFDQIQNLNDIIYSLQSKKYIPIIAHPERYKYVQKNPNILLELLDLGVLFQANYGSIIGQYGKEASKTVKLLIKNNFIHFLGSDAHRKNNIYRAIPKVMEELKKITTEEKIRELTTVNPSLVIENKEIDTRRPIKIKRSFFGF